MPTNSSPLRAQALAAGPRSGSGHRPRRRRGSGFRERDPGRDVILALTLGRLRASLARQLAEDGFHVVPMDDGRALARHLADHRAGVVIASSDLPGLDALHAEAVGRTPLLVVVPPHAADHAPPILGAAFGVLYEPVDIDDIRTVVWNTVR